MVDNDQTQSPQVPGTEVVNPGPPPTNVQSHEEHVVPTVPEPTPTTYKPQSTSLSSKKVIIGIIFALVIIVSAAVLFMHPYSKPVTTTSTIQPTTQISLSGITTCTTITKPGSYYIERDINTNLQSGACINIETNNVRLIGNQNKIVGNGPFVVTAPATYGIRLSGSNISIEGVYVSKFSYDFYASNLNNSALSSITAYNSTITGLYLENSFNNTISNSNIGGSESNQGGVHLISGSNNRFFNDSSKTNAYYGFYIASSGNEFSNLTLNNNPVDMYCIGNNGFRMSNKFSSSSCNVNNYCEFAYCADTNLPINLSSISLPNTITKCGGISQKGVFYLGSSLNASQFVNTSGELSSTVPCITINSPDVTLECNNQTISNSGYGIFVNSVFNTTLNNCKLVNNTKGIYVYNSFATNIYNTSITHGKYGIYLEGSTKGTVSSTNYSNNQYGLYITSTTGFLFNNNDAHGNFYGVYVNSGQTNSFNQGIMTNNTKSDLYCTSSTYNSTENLFVNTKCGITDCNWGSSCTVKQLPPISTYPLTECTPIITSGNYSLQDSVISNSKNPSSSCFSIEASNVTLNCNHYNVSGLAGSGFYISRQNNVTLDNCNINGYQYGILANDSNYLNVKNTAISSVYTAMSLYNSSYSNIVNTSSVLFSYNGLSLNKVSNTIIINNTASNGALRGIGFSLVNSYNNIFVGNKARFDTTYGFLFHNSTGNTVSNNTAQSNGIDYSCLGSSSGIYAQNGGVNSGTSKQNCIWLVEVNPLQQQSCYSITTGSHISFSQDMYYPYGATCFAIFNAKNTSGSDSIINCNGHTIKASKGGVFADVINSTNVEIENCYLIGFTNAIESTSSYTKIFNNTIAMSNRSISISNSRYSTVLNNVISNSSYGIYAQNYSYSSILNNRIFNTDIGMEMSGGEGSTVRNNTVSGGRLGLYLINSQITSVQDNVLNGSTSGISCVGYAENKSSENADNGGNVCSSNTACRWMTSSTECAV